MNKQRALTLGVTAGLVILGGIIMNVLLTVMVQNVVYGEPDGGNTTDFDSMRSFSSASVWMFGLMYIVPGLFGLCAAFAQNKCLYITTCVISMLSLLIMGILCLIGGMALFILVLGIGSISEHCYDTGDSCSCRKPNSESPIHTIFSNCQTFQSFYDLFMAVLFFIILTWVAMIVEFVLACYFSCRSQSSTGGMVLLPPQQPMLNNEQGMVLPEYGMDYPPPSKV